MPRWVFSQEQLENSPSRADGISKEVEVELRHRGCCLIRSLIKKLQQVKHPRRPKARGAGNDQLLWKRPTVTAMTLFHRFFVRQSLQRHSKELVAAAATLLATKSYEQHFKAGDIARALEAVLPGEFRGAKAAILLKEKILLFTLEFDITVELPIPDAALLDSLRFSKDLRTLFQEGDRAKRLRRSAEGVVWDVHYSPLCLRFYPWEIRIGCVCLASYLLDIEPPESWVTRNCMELPRLADFMASTMEYYLSFKEPVKGVESSVEPSPKRFRVGSTDSPSAGGTPLDEPA